MIVHAGKLCRELLCLFFFIVCYSGEVQAEQHRLSFAPRPPEGYVAIQVKHSRNWITPLALEMAFRGDALLQLYILDNEKSCAEGLELDLLSGTATTIWFQDISDIRPSDYIETGGLEAVISNGKLPQSAYGAIATVEWDKYKEGMTQKANQPRIAAIQKALTATPNKPNEKQKFDTTQVDNWLQKTRETPQSDLDLGLLENTREYTIIAWLQSANNSYFSYGLPLAKSLAIVYVLIPVKDKVLGIIFADAITSSSDVLATVKKATQYAQANHDNLYEGSVFSLPTPAASNSVLDYMAYSWLNRGEWNKASAAFKMLLAQGHELHIPYTGAVYAADLGAIYKIQDIPQATIDEILPILISAEKNQECIPVKLYETVAQAYYAMQQRSKSAPYYDKGLKLARTHYGELHEVTIGFQSRLARATVEENAEQAKRLIQDALVWSIESGNHRWTTSSLSNALAASGFLVNPRQMSFYSKLTTAYILTCGTSLEEVLHVDSMYPAALEVFKIAVKTYGSASEAEVETWLQSSHSSSDSPFTKMNKWMRGPEIDLYRQYEKVATRLRLAGAGGAEEEKLTARATFREWLQSVDTLLQPSI